MCLYDWYLFFQSDFLSEICLNTHGKCFEGLTNIDYQMFKEEEFETLKFTLDTQLTQCDICYLSSDKGQSHFLILPQCQHYFCKPCIKEYCTDLISRGEIQKLFCPHSGCKTFLNETNLQNIGMEADLIEKLNVFSINQAIDGMDDFGWCPLKECGSPAEIDIVKNFGRCTQCGFQFCLTCKGKYHFFKRCPAIIVTYNDEEAKDKEPKKG